MVSFNTLLILAAASTAMVLPKRDVATILADIKTIDTNVAAVTSATTSYNGGLVNALPISTAEQTLETSVKKATTDAQAQTTPLSSTDSTTVLNAASNLTTGISSTLNALAAKKANFQTDGLTATVTGDISNLKTETDALADGLIAVASPDTKTAANELKTKIDAQFASASASFAMKR